ncbi:UNVERIFIED_CONTAM: hypothetical protein PYX00_002650 [Menopon gallinae]|uniref:Heparan-alpha-glucosaminide N-acetyltransferase catalytic domain-containing protein n=1 Tax=Menopon gallinae TaxID=328185 RepID=A0AAW2HYQ3_9NEOP
MRAESVLWPGARSCGDSKMVLKLNECCFDIFSSFNSSSRLYIRNSECLECDFTGQKSVIRPLGKTSFILNVEYPTEFYIKNREHAYCNRSFHFGDLGKYSMNVSHDLCSDVLVKAAPESAWVNIAVVLSVLTTVLLGYGMYKFIATAKCCRPVRSDVPFHELEVNVGGTDSRNSQRTYNSQTRCRRHSRIAAIDVFRGIAITLMIFVNYGGGGYRIFRHSPWDGLTVADLVFPWFIWLMGVSVALSLRSKLRTSVPRKKILTHILNRTLILIILGLVINSGSSSHGRSSDLDSFSSLRIPGVLQRIGLTYCIVALTELVFARPQRNEQYGPWNLCADVVDSIVQWVIALAFVAAHAFITFMLPVPGCPTGYLGPGGRHRHSQFENCTGGAAGYIDRLLLSENHLYQHPTCQKIYQTRLPYDPEGLLGTMTSVFCAFLGLHAGRIILCYENTASRLLRWLTWGMLLGLIGSLLCNFMENDGFVPINKNLWSISYVCIASSSSFIIFSGLYWLVDYRRFYGGFPFVYAGMNALVLYVGHDILKKFLPWYWKPYSQTHMELLAMNITATAIWLLIAFILYRHNILVVL